MGGTGRAGASVREIGIVPPQPRPALPPPNCLAGPRARTGSRPISIGRRLSSTTPGQHRCAETKLEARRNELRATPADRARPVVPRLRLPHWLFHIMSTYRAHRVQPMTSTVDNSSSERASGAATYLTRLGILLRQK